MDANRVGSIYATLYLSRRTERILYKVRVIAHHGRLTSWQGMCLLLRAMQLHDEFDTEEILQDIHDLILAGIDAQSIVEMTPLQWRRYFLMANVIRHLPTSQLSIADCFNAATRDHLPD